MEAGISFARHSGWHLLKSGLLRPLVTHYRDPVTAKPQGAMALRPGFVGYSDEGAECAPHQAVCAPSARHAPPPAWRLFLFRFADSHLAVARYRPRARAATRAAPSMSATRPASTPTPGARCGRRAGRPVAARLVGTCLFVWPSRARWSRDSSHPTRMSVSVVCLHAPCRGEGACGGAPLRRGLRNGDAKLTSFPPLLDTPSLT